jgi:nitroreductase
MAKTLPLGLDELLTTTRSVRRLLDFTRPIERHVVEECVEIAMQAPTPSNLQNWHFVIVTDPDKRMALADLYRKGREIYVTLPSATANIDFGDRERNATQQRIEESAQYLNTNFQDAPVLVVPCISGRTDHHRTPRSPVGVMCRRYCCKAPNGDRSRRQPGVSCSPRERAG